MWTDVVEQKSAHAANPPDGTFKRIAYVVACTLVELVEELSTQVLLVTPNAEFDGFTTDEDRVRETVHRILSAPLFIEREDAEKSRTLQQVVPYAVLENEDGAFFWARRRSDTRRKELRGKYTILVGGHAEKRDWESGPPDGVFRRCLEPDVVYFPRPPSSQ